MFQAAISELTTSRWSLADEVDRLAAHGFESLALWRPKLSDVGPAAAADILSAAGMRASSLHWAGGFTGGDGRTFAESIDDAQEAIEAAAVVGAPVLVVHSGCRGGHTRAHAGRLLVQALETLAPAAAAAGVQLALEPVHAAAAPGYSFIARLGDALEIVERLAHPSIRLSLDLWQFGDAPELPRLLPRLAAVTALVQVADRCGPPTPDMERLPAGRGSLALESAVFALLARGFTGDFTFDPIGEAVAAMGYDRTLADLRTTASSWSERLLERQAWSHAAAAVRQAAGMPGLAPAGT